MDLRKTFNEDAANYDRARPGYVPELYADILAYKPLTQASHALEIGIGTGQATPPILQRGCHVTAAELGEDLAEYSRRKFAGYDRFRVVQGDFMQMDVPDASLDLIYSATAFHWLPQAEALQKCLRCLKPGGAIALFWNHPYPNRESDPSNAVNRRVYAKHRPSNRPLVEGTDTTARANALAEAGFADVQVQLYHRVRTLTTDEYIALINTYSDHRALPEAIRTAFEADMRAGLAEVGGRINIYDTQSLYLARKPR